MEAETCFNEAAAQNRGKHIRVSEGMKHTPRFNEAAAQNRGKPPSSLICPSPYTTRFNEAAAQNRGKLMIDVPTIVESMMLQ